MDSGGRTFEGLKARIGAMVAEHERRMREDPAYRAEQEKLEAERVAFERDQREREAARAAEARDQRRRDAGIPERVIRLLNGGLRETEALTVTRRFVAERRKTFLVLGGGTGPGKTVAAGWSVDRDGGVLVKAMQLTRAGTYGDEAEAFWRRLHGASVLALDDLGMEPRDEKGWAEANLAALLDDRYDAEAPTVITTNLTLAQFDERYLSSDGGRLRDRFAEAGVFFWLRGESLRGDGARP